MADAEAVYELDLQMALLADEQMVRLVQGYRGEGLDVEEVVERVRLDLVDGDEHPPGWDHHLDHLASWIVSTLVALQDDLCFSLPDTLVAYSAVNLLVDLGLMDRSLLHCAQCLAAVKSETQPPVRRSGRRWRQLKAAATARTLGARAGWQAGGVR